MKRIILSMAVVALMISVNSCIKCTTCTKSGSPDLKYCENQYSTKDAYDDAVALATLGGYDCK
jgi:histone acetyltransferase (RNA polymerase elongator complex component)